MFGSSKPVVFEPYGRRRSRWRLPRWLVLLLVGIALGAGGVVFVQERYLPKRLSADASAKLSSAFEQADADRQRLKTELGQTTQRLAAALGDKQSLSEQLATSRSTAERLRDDVASVVASLPPDPRGGGVEVRAGRFTAKGGVLAYDLVLTRERASAKPISGALQLVVAGDSARGATTVTLKPIALAIGSHEVVRGSQPLPDGFVARQATVQVTASGKPVGMRVMLVK
ncbi:MAG TPA: hypothetical protein VJ598_08225 [Albitalea sp.]|nr:hypothetical protein [Albitalea sp.]